MPKCLAASVGNGGINRNVMGAYMLNEERADRLSLLMSNKLDSGVSKLDAVLLKAETSAVIYSLWGM